MISDEIRAKLNPAYHFRRTHSMASLLDDAPGDGMYGIKAGKEMLGKGIFAAGLKNSAKIGHDLSQDTVANLVQLANEVHDAPAPMAIGEMLVRKVDVGPGTRKIRVRDRGKAVPTGDGMFSRGQGGSNRFVTLDPNLELESHSTWDRNYEEDADWNVAMDEARAVATGLKEECSQVCIDGLKDIPVADTSGGAIYAPTTADSFVFKDIVNMRANMLSLNTWPNAVVMNPLVSAGLLVDDAFTDSFRYGDMVDKRGGHLGMVYNMTIFETSQISKAHVYMLNTNEVMAMGVRRDAMIESYMETQNAKTQYGIKASTRYDLQAVQPEFLLRCTDAHA